MELAAKVALAAFLFLTANTAQSPVFCAEPEAWSGALSEQYGEVPIWSGIGPDGRSRMILTSNKETGTWTIGVQLADKPLICTQASGFDSKLEHNGVAL